MRKRWGMEGSIRRWMLWRIRSCGGNGERQEKAWPAQQVPSVTVIYGPMQMERFLYTSWRQSDSSSMRLEKGEAA